MLVEFQLLQKCFRLIKPKRNSEEEKIFYLQLLLYKARQSAVEKKNEKLIGKVLLKLIHKILLTPLM